MTLADKIERSAAMLAAMLRGDVPAKNPQSLMVCQVHGTLRRRLHTGDMQQMLDDLHIPTTA